jgi:hypothetical protein
MVVYGQGGLGTIVVQYGPASLHVAGTLFVTFAGLDVIGERRTDEKKR